MDTVNKVIGRCLRVEHTFDLLQEFDSPTSIGCGTREEKRKGHVQFLRNLVDYELELGVSLVIHTNDTISPRRHGR